MAKSQIKTYIFTPGIAGAGTIKVPGKVDLSQLLLITNVKSNIIIYNFSDPTFSGTTVSFSRSNSTDFPTTLQNSDGYTTISLPTNTSSMSSSDILQIFIDQPFQYVRMPDVNTDAFERIRVSPPVSMLDADFEYGLQPTKWQTLELMRNYPSVYELPGSDMSVVTVTTDAAAAPSASLITINTVSPHGMSIGQPFTVKGYLNTITGFARAEGTYTVIGVPSSTQITYYAKGRVGTSAGQVISTTYTQLRKAGFFTGASIGTPTFTYDSSSPAIITITFITPHGLVPSDSIMTIISSDDGSNNHSLAQGAFLVESVPTVNTLTFTARAVGLLTGTITGSVYSRPDAFFIHRPFDGGVMLGTGGPSYGAAAIRMSKKYIRYQSGKAINYNTGALFAPSYDVRTISATATSIGSVVSVTTDDVDHGLQANAVITLQGVISSGYNGTYTVASVVDERTFTFLATSILETTTPAIDTPCQISLTSWYGGTVRAGTFDDQNGHFLQFDGQTFALGLRSSTFQLSGFVDVVPDSNLISGTSTRFTSQLIAGDRVVIKGMTHVVSQVVNDTTLYITPDYRGSVSATGVKMIKTKDIIIPQSQFNVDRVDGSETVFNPSGFKFTANKMQMIGIQWTWYGAGFIDYMMRGPSGNYITIHRIKNGGVNTEAYMRTGNMPVRYEVVNEGPVTKLSGAITSSTTTIPVISTTYFPNSGTVYIDNEIVNYTGKTSTTLTGCTRAATFQQFAAGSTKTFAAGIAASHNLNAGVILIGQTATPQISHWGSAFLQDGGFDTDRGYIFNYATTNVSISTTKQTAFLIRLAPSVSNAQTGDLGVRELLNRAQLLLNGIDVTSDSGTGGIVVEGILNPQNYPTDPNLISWNGLSSSASGGQPSFAQIALGGSVTWNGTGPSTTATLTTQSSLTTSVSTAAVYSNSGSLSNSGPNGGFIGKNLFYISTANYATIVTTQGVAAGDKISGTGIPSNTIIQAIATTTTSIGGVNYYAIQMSQNFSATTSGSITITITRSMNTSSTSVWYYTSASWVASGAGAGTSIVADSFFAAGTTITSATAVTFNSTTYYKVTMSQTSSISTITPGTTTTVVTISAPIYATPGETVFSFISAPGGTNSLDLTSLKELTNTAIGGRGTYPNGPDVLAVNVYKASGTAINCSLVLRWGEAQA